MTNVILAVFDTTRFDDWTWLDSELEADRRVTPFLDALAADSQRFTNARSLYTATVPSHVSMFTGHSMLPSRGTGSPLRDPRFGYESSSLFTILGAHGYRTYAFSGNKNLDPETIDALKNVDVTSSELHERMTPERLAAILRAYGEHVPDPEELTPADRDDYDRHVRVIMGSADNVNAVALAAMTEHAHDHSKRPYFLFLNYNDAHDPYFPEPPFDTRFETAESEFNGNLWSLRTRTVPDGMERRKFFLTALGLSSSDIQRARDLHLGELSYADNQFGVLLDELRALRLLEDTVIVATSDHGELFGENGRMSHSGKGTKELLHVPLFMRFPDEDLEPSRFDAKVDLRDIKPTLLDYLGIDDDSSRGRSLWPLVRDGGGALAAQDSGSDRPEDEGENLIAGQDPETTERLAAQLEALGYLEAARAEGTNVLLISIDTLRPDHMGIYGYERDTTPRIDAFFRKATVIANASSSASCTIPSIRQYLYGAFDQRPDREPLAALLAGHGYRTAAVVSQQQIHKDGLERYGRGFESFDVQAPEAVDAHGMTTRTAQEVSDGAIRWLEGNARGQKFFLWLHYFDPHDPYAPPEAFRGFDAGNQSRRSGDVRHYLLEARERNLGQPGRRGEIFDAEDAAHMTNLYDGEVLYADAELGRVFDALRRLGLESRTLAILTSDHGEWLGEKKRWGHCLTLREPEVRVPLLIRTAGTDQRLAGVDRDAPASTLDILPTIAGELGLAYDASAYHGIDLGRAQGRKDRTVLSFWRGNAMLRKGQWKQLFARGNPRSLFDLSWDPAETRNLLEEEVSVAEELAADMAAFRDLAESVESDNREVVEQLRQIGYVD